MNTNIHYTVLMYKFSPVFTLTSDGRVLWFASDSLSDSMRCSESESARSRCPAARAAANAVGPESVSGSETPRRAHEAEAERRMRASDCCWAQTGHDPPPAPPLARGGAASADEAAEVAPARPLKACVGFEQTDGLATLALGAGWGADNEVGDL